MTYGSNERATDVDMDGADGVASKATVTPVMSSPRWRSVIVPVAPSRRQA